MRTDKKVWRNRKAKKDLARRLQSENPGLEVVHPHAAEIDVGNGAHYAAVRPDRDSQPVRRFECFTADLYRLADWLQSCGVQTVALQLAGVYWIPLYNILEERGFEVYLVNARHTKNDVQEKPVAAEVTHLRIVEQLIPTTVRDSYPAHLLAAATTTRHGSSDLCATYAKSPDANEYSAGQCDQRSEGVTGQLIVRAIVGSRTGPLPISDSNSETVEATIPQAELFIANEYLVPLSGIPLT
jgi:hypothetical protein